MSVLGGFDIRFLQILEVHPHLVHVERMQKLVQDVSVVEIPVLIFIQYNLLCHQKTYGLEPIRSSKVRGVVEDWQGGGKIPVDGWDVVRLVGVWVEVVVKIGQGERVYSVSNPAKQCFRKLTFDLKDEDGNTKQKPKTAAYK